MPGVGNKGGARPAANPAVLALLRSQAKAKPPASVEHPARAPADNPQPLSRVTGVEGGASDSPPSGGPRLPAGHDAPAPPLSQEPQASVSEVVSHAAQDSIFFARHFFPKTFRQESPPFHRDMWGLLDDPLARYVNIQVMRGGAKTTIARTYMAKRIAYGLSRTILYIGSSEPKAKDSIEWMKSQVDRNRLYAKTFNLRKGKIWQTDNMRILHGTEDHVVALQAYGITGSIRGTNIDDHRPDLIVVDDVIKDDNAATADQRRKITELILGAVKESLAPASEVPDAKMVIINTPQDFEDLSQLALRDPQFRSARFGCWTKETEHLALEEQLSSWPERWSSETLRSEKRAAIARNMLSTFAREMECQLITPETSAFRAEWIRYFGPGEAEPEPPRHEMWVELVIDPVPPPSEIQIAKGLQGKDYEALTAIGRWRNKYYVLETIYNRGHQPNWTVATFFEMCNRWSPRKVIVESIAYQATLAWLLREGMKRTGRFYPIQEFKDKRRKLDRITDGLSGPLSNGALFFRPRGQETAISQVIHFPGKNPDGTHDDVIETIAIGVMSLSKGHVGDIAVDFYKQMEEDIPELEYARGAP